MRLLLFGHTTALTLRWLPELIDVEHRVDHGILQLAADRLHAADVRRDHGVLLVVEPERAARRRSEEHTSELQSLAYLVCRLLLEKKKKKYTSHANSAFNKPGSELRR